MPIENWALDAPGDGYLALRGDASVADAFAHLFAPEIEGRTSWKLLVLRTDGAWVVIGFDGLSNLVQRSPERLRQPLDEVELLTPARTVERSSMSTGEAQKEATRSPGRLLVVTDQGTLAGVVSVTIRGAEVFRGGVSTPESHLRELAAAYGGSPRMRHAMAAGQPLAAPAVAPGARERQRELRYTDISCPQQVWRRTPRFTVTVCLTVDDPGELTAGDQALAVDPGQPVTVRLAAPGFELLSPAMQEMKLIPGKDSKPQVFHLRPAASGHLLLAFDFLQAGQPLGTVSVPVEVVAERLAEEQRRTRRRSVHTSAEAEAPDRALYIRWDPEASQLKPVLVEGGGLSWREFRPVSLPGKPADWAEQLFGDLTSLAHLADPVSRRRVLRADDVDRRLKKLGQSLWSRLPEELRSTYGEQRDGWRDHSLLILSNEPYLPWELVWPYGRGWEDPEPWCLSLKLSRWLVQDADGNGNPEPPAGLPLGTLACVAPPDSGLPAAQHERAFLRDLIARRELKDASPRPTWPAVMDLLEQGGYDWLHVAAHGNFYAEAPDRHSGLWLESEQALVPEHLVGPAVEEHLATARPAFFMNACHAGRLGWSWNGLEGWADRLITLGAGMFLAPLWAAEDAAALTLARVFYRRLLDGETVAEALRQARRAARSPGNPTWCAYSLYAHPNARLRLPRDRAA